MNREAAADRQKAIAPSDPECDKADNSDIPEHVVLYTSLHGDGDTVFIFHTRLSTVARQARHLLAKFFI